MDVEQFIARWSEATMSERANGQSFIIELCAVLGVAAPGQQAVEDRDYCFERTVKFPLGEGRISCRPVRTAFGRWRWAGVWRSSGL